MLLLLKVVFATAILAVTSCAHLASFVIMLPKLLKYSTFSNCFWSTIICTGDGCLETLFIYLFIYYVITMIIAQTVQRRKVDWLVSNKFEQSRRKSTVKHNALMYLHQLTESFALFKPSSGNFISLWRCDPKRAVVSSFLRSLDHTSTHHSRYDSSGRVIGPSQRPPLNNTQHSQQTYIHVPRWDRTHILSRRAAADPHLKPRGHWDRSDVFITKLYKDISKR